MLNFLFVFFLEVSETLKSRISGTETDIRNETEKAFSSVFNGRPQERSTETEKQLSYSEYTAVF